MLVVYGADLASSWDEIDRRLNSLNPEKRKRIDAHLRRILDAEEELELLVAGLAVETQTRLTS